MLRFTTGEEVVGGQSKLDINFRSDASNTQKLEFSFPNIMFGVSDFTNLSTSISTATINWSAISKNSENADDASSDDISTAKFTI